MSEQPIAPNGDEHIHVSEADFTSGNATHAALDEQKVKQALVKKRLQGMSKSKKITWLVVILLVLSGAGYGYTKWKASKTPSTYSTATVKKGTVTDFIEATGTLKAVRESALGFKNDDTITAINVQSGDHVTAGQILAKQDPATLNNVVQQAQNTVYQDGINVQSSNLTLATNLQTLERQQQLFEAGAISQTDLNTAQNSYTKSQLDLELTQAKLANDQTKLSQAGADLAQATIVAPFDGIIGAVNGQVGQINGINSASSTLLTVMSNDLQISSLVNEADIGRIKVGQEVEFSSSSFSNKTFTGQVMRITPQATTVSNVQYYPVLISCNDPNGVLLSGMSVSVKVIVARESDVLTVPMMAVSYAQTYLKSNPSLAPSGNGKAVVVMQNDQPVVKAVTLGISDGSNYVATTGLNSGDIVIVGTTSTTTTKSTTGTGTSSGTTTRSTNSSGGNFGGPAGGF
ncbi:MAG: efflux RND transporter periplasmic adaptor subunit [Firmicutes bacterium]|nr:efflux RND transporter periplasmic adaptor subunit [Bacillota bacterium]